MANNHDLFLKYLLKKNVNVEYVEHLLQNTITRRYTQQAMIHKLDPYPDSIDYLLVKEKQIRYQLLILSLLKDYMGDKIIDVEITDNGTSICMVPNTVTTAVHPEGTPTDSFESASQSLVYEGIIYEFNQEENHGYIQPNDNSNELIFVRSSNVEGSYMPKKGDVVTFEKMSITSTNENIIIVTTNEDVMAVHMKPVHFAEDRLSSSRLNSL